MYKLVKALKFNEKIIFKVAEIERKVHAKLLQI